MHEIDRTIEAVRTLTGAGKRGVLVTIIGTHGSTYRRAGARVVISEHGEAFGMISGGCVERDLAERVRPWLANGSPRLFTYDNTAASDILFGLGLGCRGVIEMLVEPFDAEHLPPLVTGFRWNGRQPVVWTTMFEGREVLVESIRPQRVIAVYGSGADVTPLIRIGSDVGWRVEQFSPKTMDIDGTAFDAAVVMTHNFLFDLTLLEALLPSAIPYVGLLGPRSRGEELLRQLPESVRALRAKLHSPIGLNLGGETPEDIALSIVAEIQAVLNCRSAESLHERNAPIHEPEQAPWG
jgi:xanthine/CO dehydrogenase XdhC/CoxF family maturation factor